MNFFDYPISSEEEQKAALETELDAVISQIGEKILEGERDPGILVPDKLYQFRLVHEAFKAMTHGTDAKVTYALHEPFRSMGSVFVEGRDLCFADTGLFARVLQLADNVEVYPLTNGEVRMAATFHDIVKPI